MKILSAKVVRLRGSPDYVYLDTDLPSPFPQYAGHKLILKFDAPRDSGEQYVWNVFGLHAEVVSDGC